MTHLGTIARGCRLGLIGWAALFGWAGSSVQAASISASRVHPDVLTRQQLWNFWSHGNTRWQTTYPLPRFPTIRALTFPNGQLRSTPAAQSLEWRRERNPNIFDRRFFRIAPIFQHQNTTTTAQQVASTLSRLPRTAAFQVLIPPDGSNVEETPSGQVTVSVSPQLAEQNFGEGSVPVPSPSPVPEPSTFVIGLGLICAAGWYRGRRVSESA